MEDSVEALAYKGDLIYESKRESLRHEIDRLREFLLQMSKDRDLLHKQEQTAHILCKRKLEWTEKKLQETQDRLNETQNEAACLLESKHLEMETMQKERDEALKKAEIMNEELCFLRRYGDHLEEQFSGLIFKLHECYEELQLQTEDMVNTFERSEEEWLPVRKTVTRFGSCLQEFQKTTSQLSMEKDHYLYLNGEGQPTVINDEIGMNGRVTDCEVNLKNDRSPLMSFERTSFPGLNCRFTNGEENCSDTIAEEKKKTSILSDSTNFTRLVGRFAHAEENFTGSTLHDNTTEEKMKISRFTNAEENVTNCTFPTMLESTSEEKLKASCSLSKMCNGIPEGKPKNTMVTPTSDHIAEEKTKNTMLPAMSDHITGEKEKNTVLRNMSDHIAEEKLRNMMLPAMSDHSVEEKNTMIFAMSDRVLDENALVSAMSDRMLEEKPIVFDSKFESQEDFVNMGIDMENGSGIWCPTKMRKLEQAIMDAHRRYMLLCKGESESLDILDCMEGTQSAAHQDMYKIDEEYMQETPETFEDEFTSDNGSDIVSEFLEKVLSKDRVLKSRRSRYDDHFLAQVFADEDELDIAF